MPLVRRSPSLPALLASALLAAGGCDFLEDPDEVQNSSNNAFIEAQVFESRSNRAPVQGVIIIVESDPDAPEPFLGPDQSFVSDETGFIRAEVFPGIDVEQEPPGGPTSPLDAAPPLFFGDACVSFIFDGNFFSFSCGVTIGAGTVLNIGQFFVSDFVGVPAEGEE
ncbi:MAG: hypothetical protein ABR599_10290 [Gemmatimonadota bacterium]